MKTEPLLTILNSLLICLFSYASATKFINIPAFRVSLELQPFGTDWNSFLVWAIPAGEAGAALLLLFPYTRRYGLIVSVLLLLLFTVYTSLVLFGYYPERPCACGGLIGELSWNGHLLLNLFFTGIAAMALALHIKSPVRYFS